MPSEYCEKHFSKHLETLGNKNETLFLFKHEPIKLLSITNKGYRVQKHQVFTYEQRKQGLNSFYPKRLVFGDGIKTASV